MAKFRYVPNKSNIEVLIWFYGRLINVYGENRSYDYMHRFRQIIEELRGEEFTEEELERILND